MAFAFEKLVVYQKSVDFVDQACQFARQFPRGHGFLVDRINRAALSVAANIAEGQSALSGIRPNAILFSMSWRYLWMDPK